MSPTPGMAGTKSTLSRALKSSSPERSVILALEVFPEFVGPRHRFGARRELMDHVHRRAAKRDLHAGGCQLHPTLGGATALKDDAPNESVVLLHAGNVNGLRPRIVVCCIRKVVFDLGSFFESASGPRVAARTPLCEPHQLRCGRIRLTARTPMPSITESRERRHLS